MAIRERKKRIYRKRIPYGMQNFEDIRKRDCYYVDKTPFIEDIEDSNMYFFYIRPRRFGKSLTLSMLENYYDINKADQFQEIFGGLYIGENPTPEHNTYLVIHLNFAEVADEHGNFIQAFEEYCKKVYSDFANKYSVPTVILPLGVPTDLQSVVKKRPNLFILRICNPPLHYITKVSQVKIHKRDLT